MTTKSSYSQILKASSIMGGAAAVKMLVKMVETKCAAVLLGAGGVGLITNFTAIQAAVGTFAGFGLQSSAVRDVVAAVSRQDEHALGRAVLTLRRMCWLTGLMGMVGMILLSPIISQLTFHQRDYTNEIALLGLVILMANLTGAQMAVIQGMRRMGDLAKINIIGVTVSAVSAVGFYLLLGVHGIIPGFLLAAIIQLMASWRYARRIPVPKIRMTWRQTFHEAGDMVHMGIALMWTGLLFSAFTYFTATLVTNQLGVESVGIYSAANSLSGVFVNFVLQAMGADYYPRLIASTGDKKAINQVVNEQTVIGLLLTLPGLCATIALAPVIVQVFYSPEFSGATKLLQWFIFGCLGRVISWPLSYVMLALGRGKWYFFTETFFYILHFSLVFILLSVIGLEGVAVAFVIMYITYFFAVYLIAKFLAGVFWLPETKKLVRLFLPIMLSLFLVLRSLSFWPGLGVGVCVTIVVGIACLRSLLQKGGEDHKISRFMCLIPLLGKLTRNS